MPPQVFMPQIAAVDLYPSRVKSQAEILERHDPVVHGGPQDGPLSADQLQQFDRDGLLILPDFLSANEVAACVAELDQLREQPEIRQRPESIIEPNNNELRSLFSIHKPEISSLFANVAADERIVGMAEQIVGSEVYIHQSRVNLKPGFVGKEFYWHSDFETWHVEDGMPRMRAISCSILLTDNDDFNGPLMLIPGSHRQFIACVGETPDNHYQMSLRRQDYGVPDHDSLTQLAEFGGIVNSTGPAGTLLLFDCNTMHGSNSNITPFPRSNLFFVYNSTTNQLNEPYCGKPPRPEYIAARKDCETVVPRCIDYSRGNVRFG